MDNASSVRVLLPVLAVIFCSWATPQVTGFLLVPAPQSSFCSSSRLCSSSNNDWSIVDNWSSRSQDENGPRNDYLWAPPDNMGNGYEEIDSINDKNKLAEYDQYPYASVDSEETVFKNVDTVAIPSKEPDKSHNTNSNSNQESKQDDTWMQQFIQDLYDHDRLDLTREEEETRLSPMDRESFMDEEVMDQEIAALVRCNQDPSQFLIANGRKVAPLTDAQLYNVTQLILFDESTQTFEATQYLKDSMGVLLQRHGRPQRTESLEEDQENIIVEDKMEQDLIMDAPAVARWLQTCLSIAPSRCGPHDPRVNQVLSKFGKYKQAYLEPDDLLSLYQHALVGDFSAPTHLIASTAHALLSERRSYEISQVWRDLRQHGLEPPVQTKWREETQALAEQIVQSLTVSDASLELFHDECQLEEPEQQSWNQDDETGDWQRTGQSSHQKIELCPTNSKIPLRFRDGDFVYIDEESCIGCMQCTSAAPGTFYMLDNGRARTFAQDTSADVAAAVTSCPVNCMHYVGYDRLVELEQARDEGTIFVDKPNDHHRHFGPKQAPSKTKSFLGATGLHDEKTQKKQTNGASEQEEQQPAQWIDHTPLYVSRMESSDANHKESIYHHLRNKCYKSKACPQKGCYDCPMYASNPTSNPHWKKRVQEANHVRAQTFCENGTAESFRTKAEL